MEQIKQSRRPRGRRIEKLTDSIIKAARPRARDYQLPDGRNLILVVRASGSKIWRQRYRLHGRSGVCVIGHWPDFNVETARTDAAEIRLLVARGINPVEHRRQEFDRKKAEHERQRAESEAAAYTVKACLDDWLAGERAKKHLPKANLVRKASFVRIHLAPAFGAKSVGKLTAVDIAKWRDAHPQPNTVSLCLAWLRAALRLAGDHGKVDKAHVAELCAVKFPKFKVTHRDPLTPQALGALWRDLEKHPDDPSSIGVRLVLLLFPRGTELRTAKWEELCDIETHDVNGDTVQVPAWRLPKGRSKMETDHIFPLSPEAIALFDKLRTITEKKSPVYCFPGRFKNKPA